MNIIDRKLSFRGNLRPLNMDSINGIVFHHMAHPSWGLEDVHIFHRDSNGWAGIGYNYFIDFDGNVYKGRGLHQGAHARGHNSSKIGIGFQGNFDNQKMTDQQVHAGNELVKWLFDQIGRDVRLYGHKDVGVTACPGRNFRMSEMTGNVSSPKPQTGGMTVLLRRGDSGRNVKQLQSDLIRLGYDLGSHGADGRFGPATKNGLMQFQNDAGITVDGIAGPETYGAIESALQDDNTLYRVQVGAFSNEANALAMEQELKRAGFETYVVKQ